MAIPSAESRLDAYPHELSGGLRQRVVIAIALLTDPELIIADEPTTALDVTIQAEIMALILKLCRENDVALILITHDLGVVAEVTERLMIMYAGKCVETGATDAIIEAPHHPYSAWPSAGAAAERRARHPALPDPRLHAADHRPALGLRLSPALRARHRADAGRDAAARERRRLFPPPHRTAEDAIP